MATDQRQKPSLERLFSKRSTRPCPIHRSEAHSHRYAQTGSPSEIDYSLAEQSEFRRDCRQAVISPTIPVRRRVGLESVSLWLADLCDQLYETTFDLQRLGVTNAIKQYKPSAIKIMISVGRWSRIT